jgi:hypothetical protein
MLAALFLTALSATPAAADPPARVGTHLMPRRCPELSGDGEVVVCGERERPYRIDPDVLAGQRARDVPPEDTRTAQEKAVQGSCHDTYAKCQGSGTIPILAPALKTIQAVVLAAKGEDWRQPFRSKPDDYQAYQAAQGERRAKIDVSLVAGASSGAPPRP